MAKEAEENIFCCYQCPRLFMGTKKDRCNINNRLINQPGESCPPSWCPKGYTNGFGGPDESK